ncbi:hypothetical protein ARMGADRAFT_1082207 [Armillaria gallica]|uniref:Uncharacterized protein n=1 Tax=Armillaria gallica TaxID=47427 RepID=A0A2H3D6U9_ARMGA|nr:hypothetical protein ARMGADRAFT_1082207 [Armillaria gallica]
MFLQVSSRGQYASPDQDGGCSEDVQEMDDEEMNRINATCLARHHPTPDERIARDINPVWGTEFAPPS